MKKNVLKFGFDVVKNLLAISCLFSLMCVNAIADNTVKQNVPVIRKAPPEYSLVIDTDNSSVGSGDALFLRLAIENKGNAVLSYVELNPEVMFTVIVKNSDGEIMPLTRYGNRLKGGLKNSIPQPSFFFIQELKPGIGENYKILLNRLYDMSIPGTYSISSSMVIGIGDDAIHAEDMELVSKSISVNVGGITVKRESKPVEDDKR